MSKKKNKNKRAEIRKMEQLRRKNRTRKMIGGFVIIIAIICIAVVINISMGGSNVVQEPHTVETDVSETNDEIIITASDIKTDASFYSYDSDGIEISYFIVLGENGEFHAAFDACDVCYDAKKGYVQQNNIMKCINCGLTFPIMELGVTNSGGGCWPSYLPIRIDDENIIIEKSDLDKKRYMFE
jgi:uncharacterized membrane protein